MSGVPPLRDIHKKGVFGNHHKQEESSLLKISANSKLKIFLIVQYKKSKIEPKGIDGFGYDPVFYIPKMNKTYAEMTMEEKNLISHRGKAIIKMQKLLQSNLPQIFHYMEDIS